MGMNTMPTTQNAREGEIENSRAFRDEFIGPTACPHGDCIGVCGGAERVGRLLLGRHALALRLRR